MENVKLKLDSTVFEGIITSVTAMSNSDCASGVGKLGRWLESGGDHYRKDI